MMTSLLKDIEAFLAETKVNPTTFGRLAVNDSRLLKRLQDGGRVWPETEAKIRAQMIVLRQKKAAKK